MAIPLNKTDNRNFHIANYDFKGPRTLNGTLENVSYQPGSAMRIWYNDITNNYPFHWHTDLEIILPVENYYDVCISDRDYHVLPGEILVIFPGILHQLTAPDSGKRFIFLINIMNITRLHGFTGMHFLLTQPLYIRKTDYPHIYHEIYQLLVKIRDEYFSKNNFKELVIYAHLINFFVAIGRNRLNGEHIFPDVRIDKQQEYIQKFDSVLEYIDLHYTENLRLDQVASDAGFSKFHFTRLFKQYVSVTFYEYLSCRRIKAAENLLIKPELSITEVSYQSGFTSISTFNRTFRQQKKCTPREYRALHIIGH